MTVPFPYLVSLSVKGGALTGSCTRVPSWRQNCDLSVTRFADVLIGLETALRFNQRGLETLNFIATFPLVFFLSADVEGKEMQPISAAQ